MFHVKQALEVPRKRAKTIVHRVRVKAPRSAYRT